MKLYRKADFVVLPLAVLVTAMAWWVITRPTIRDCPTITGDDYNPSALLKCANRLIEIGEDKAYRVLISNASTMGVTPDDERVALLCRVLYQQDKERPLRPPPFGAPNVPYRSMAAEDWPDLPLVFSKGIPFLLVSGYIYYGPPPNVKEYVAYCRNSGVFRVEPYKLSCWSAGPDALHALFLSEKWSRIKWMDAGKGWSYGYDELLLQHQLHVQVERMKAHCTH